VQGSDVFAFELNVSSWKAAPLKLALKDVDFMDSEPTLRVKTPASYSFLDGVYYSYYSGSHPKLNYNSTLSSFEAASGDYGVIQLSIKK
jgi:hypothetical protein